MYGKDDTYTSEEFQRARYEQRPWIQEVLDKTTDPAQAWQNWMERDVQGARSLERPLRDTGLTWESVDGSSSIEVTVNRVCAHFLRGLVA